MTPFGRLAEFYDALYADKDYPKETSAVQGWWLRHGLRPESVLDLACGTGGHGLEWVRRGYRVLGIDRSAEMLAAYRRKATALGLRVDLLEGDLRDFVVDEPRDAAVCLFDAFGYLVANDDLRAALRRIREALAPGGSLLFDVWHAAPLLRLGGGMRHKRFRQAGVRGIRTSNTELMAADQLGRVCFHVAAWDDSAEPGEGSSRLIAELEESHDVRYFLPQELRFILEAEGWEVLSLSGSLFEERPPELDDWHLTVLARTPSGSGMSTR